MIKTTILKGGVGMSKTTPYGQKEVLKVNCGLNNNSLIPIYQECEKFINQLDKKFKLGIPHDFIITINKSHPNTLGSFTPKNNPSHFKNTKQNLKVINLNTYHLKKEKEGVLNAYITLTHELAHYLNNLNSVVDCSSNQYHNKKFKIKAEELLLNVTKSLRGGWNYTTPTTEFKEMLKDFETKPEMFNVCQNLDKDKKPKGTRLYLWLCDGGCYKIRCGNKDLSVTCDTCETKFKRVDK